MLPRLQIDSVPLRRVWRSSDVDPWLRVVVIFTTLLYFEQGAKRCRLVSLSAGRTGYGRTASISVLGLPGVTRALHGDDHKTPRWIMQRLNVLFPFGDGDKETASYDGCVLRLEVPFCGYKNASAALRDWQMWGPGPKKIRPRKIRMVEPKEP